MALIIEDLTEEEGKIFLDKEHDAFIEELILTGMTAEQAEFHWRNAMSFLENFQKTFKSG